MIPQHATATQPSCVHKMIRLFTLAALMAASAVCASAQTYDAEIDGICYKIEGGEAIVAPL